ncbi:MAG: hypothetical protein SFV52_10395 [Saprospiraceae bacterium]|nr:hypothetical protein [Saprospiraceae bacterium]
MKNKFFLPLLPALLCTAHLIAQQPELQYFRPWDQRGINMFEPAKNVEQPEYTGFKIRIGGSFTQDFQSLTHENDPTYVPISGTNTTNKNLLYDVVTAEDSTSAKLEGFNLAMANLNLDFQIADGIRVSLENYMSSRHHSEFWVKGGYIQIDKLPMFNNTKWFDDYMRVKIGHFQPNFGDMQFRRTDGGNAMFNPFVENFILDAFTTEIGGEVYVFPVEGFMGMIGLTSGFINGNVRNYPEANNSFGAVPTKKSPSIYLKAAYDRQFNENLRFRLSASFCNNSNNASNTLYAGDRTGSHYFLVMEPAQQVSANGTATPTNQKDQFTSGRFNPEMQNRIQAFMINPFVKFKGFEFFGSYEILNGSNYSDVSGDPGNRSWEKRSFNQYSVEGVYRFLPREQLYAGVRYIGVSGEPRGLTVDGSQAEVNINRVAFAAGWYPTKNLLLKGEYVVQNYEDFPTNDYRNAGTFNGIMIQAVVGF